MNLMFVGVRRFAYGDVARDMGDASVRLSPKEVQRDVAHTFAQGHGIVVACAPVGPARASGFRSTGARHSRLVEDIGKRGAVRVDLPFGVADIGKRHEAEGAYVPPSDGAPRLKGPGWSSARDALARRPDPGVVLFDPQSGVATGTEPQRL